MVQKKKSFKSELDAGNPDELVIGAKEQFKRPKRSEVVEPAYAEIEDSIEIPKRQINKLRTLMVCSRGVTFVTRHLMADLGSIFVNIKTDHKIRKSADKRAKYGFNQEVREIAESRNCENILYFESRKHIDTYMYIGKTNGGPSARFLMQNVHTMAELKLIGNCLKGSRPVLSFCKSFDEMPHYKVIKELFTQVFTVPRYHAKSKPFIDHVMSFSILDGRIWVRHYQILISAQSVAEEEMSMVEIGPRFCLLPIVLYSDVFRGQCLYKNEQYVTPNAIRALEKRKAQMSLRDAEIKKEEHSKRLESLSLGKMEEQTIFA